MSWSKLAHELLADIMRSDDTPLDAVDRRGYGESLRPLQKAVLEGLNPEHADIWKIRFGIRNHKFRPTYEEVAGIVAKHLPEVAPPITRAIEAPKPGGVRLRDYKPDYKRLPPDPRDWRIDMFKDGREYFMAVSKAVIDGKIPNPGPMAEAMGDLFNQDGEIVQ